MKRIGIALLASVSLAGLSHAADLPTTKGPPAPAPNCYASFWSWLNSSASDCPLSYYGITLYGTLDVNYGYQEWGAPKSSSADKLQYGIRSNAYEHIWQAGYNGLSSNVLGLKMNEDLAPIGLAGWSLVGVLEAGINPYNGLFFNGPTVVWPTSIRRSSNGLVTLNGKSFYFQNQKTNLDSSRAGQWDNSQGYVGIANRTWGTLTFGRTNSLTYDSQSAYDPMGGAPAFSLLGFSSSFAGDGDTEIVRINTALTYKVAIPNVAGVFNTVRLAGQYQIGGYGVGNGAMTHYEGQAGFDWGNFSFDGILAWAKDAVSLSTFNGGSLGQCGLTGPSAPWYIKVNNVCYDTNNVLKATLSNNFGAELMGSYKWDRFKFFGGYIYARQSNPSDDFFSGFQTIYPGISVPGGTYNYLTAPILRRDLGQRFQLQQGPADGVDRREMVGSGRVAPRLRRARSRRRLLLSKPEQLQLRLRRERRHGCHGVHRRRRLHQQQQMRGQPGRYRFPGRLAAGQAGRHLRRHHDHQRLRRARQRLFSSDPGFQRKDFHQPPRSAHAELRPDDRHPHPVLTADVETKAAAALGLAVLSFPD